MNYTFKSADGVSTVHAVKWEPAGEVKAVLQIVHGMMEYIERYDEFARFLTGNGFVVAGHDHIGHGHTASDESELGLMHTDDPSGVMVEDIASNYRLLKGEYPNVPVFILGHSMGSYMLRKALSAKSSELSELSGAIIMGTGTEKDMLLKCGNAIIGVVKKVRGRDYKSKFVKGLMFNSYYKEYDIEGKDYTKSWLSKDLILVEKYYTDKFCTFEFSVNGYKALVDSTIYDNDVSNIEKINKNLPVLFISGSKDPVGGLSEGVKKAVEKFKTAGVKNITLKLYEDMRHEVLNEVGRDEVYSYLLGWMQENMQK